jgi:hypothetical protein
MLLGLLWGTVGSSLADLDPAELGITYSYTVTSLISAS